MKLLMKRLSLFALLAAGGLALANCRDEPRERRRDVVVSPMGEGTGGAGAAGMDRTQHTAPDSARAMQASPNVGGAGMSQPVPANGGGGGSLGTGEDIPDNSMQGLPSAVGQGVGGSGMDGGVLPDGGIPTMPGRPKAGRGK